MCSTLSCPLCCLSHFPDIDSFKLNLIKVNSKPIKCPLCDEILLGLDKLTIHLFGHSLPLEHVERPTEIMQKIKKEPKPKQNRQKVMKISVTPHTSDAKYKCEICGFVFVDENLLNLHLNLVHNFMPNNGAGTENETSEISGKKFQCHLCKKNFKMKGALRIHIRVAHMRFHDQNQRQINIADYLKSQKSISQCTLKTEMLTLQDARSPDNIYQSSVTTSPISYLAPSPQYSSGGEQKTSETKKSSDKSAKSWECSDCKKSFTTKYFLKKHKRLHTGSYSHSYSVLHHTQTVITYPTFTILIH